MKITEIKQLDYKGRLVIPLPFLKAAEIEVQSHILVSYDTNTKSIVISKLNDPDLIKAFDK